MTLRGLGVLALVAVVASSAACEALDRARGTFAELFAVQHAVQARVGSSTVQIRLNNGRFLNVIVLNSPIKDLPAESKNARARELAKVAFDAYAGRATLTKVNVVFMVQRSFLLFHYTNGTDAYDFEASDLRDAAAPVPMVPT